MAGKYKHTFIPAVSFTGFPNDVKTHFTAGVESEPMPADFIKLMRAKKLTQDAPVTEEESTIDDTNEADAEAGKPEGGSGTGEKG
ncbi:hypothetical protein [Rhizobium leguminosarum]|uniref:hypothetical protein n=1 Tax=Rhizobium leguminosarum TaxID=384 RepID=UPI00140F7958|nr:hypothetical protein [Rhizobium leguminosarum]QIO64776.1 hypothetical protein HA462_06840 [Rhizobium leguminosarum bv. trifolii]